MVSVGEVGAAEKEGVNRANLQAVSQIAVRDGEVDYLETQTDTVAMPKTCQTAETDRSKASCPQVPTLTGRVSGETPITRYGQRIQLEPPTVFSDSEPVENSRASL